MRIFLYVLLSVTLAKMSQAERITIFAHPVKLCTERMCNGREHTACRDLEPDDGCRKFQWIPETAHVVHSLLFGHNGVRNKLAEDWGIGNMNLLHWSKDLVVLSKHFLTACNITRDDCGFLVWENVTIAHSYYFSPDPASRRWMGKVIRNWYFELGYEVHGVEGLKEAMLLNHSYRSFMQMIWPTTEFVGCAAAKMFNGYLATCYYHPAPSGNWSDFHYGEGCSRCPKSRRTCSRDFGSLCGIDMNISPAGRALCSKAMIAFILAPFLSRSCFLPSA